jgi:hypothetical protein
LRTQKFAITLFALFDFQDVGVARLVLGFRSSDYKRSCKKSLSIFNGLTIEGHKLSYGSDYSLAVGGQQSYHWIAPHLKPSQ